MEFLLRQRVPREAASRLGADGGDGVSAARRTLRDDPVFEIGRDIFHGRNGTGVFFVLQRPLLHGAVNLAEVIDARVGLGLFGRRARGGSRGKGLLLSRKSLRHLLRLGLSRLRLGLCPLGLNLSGLRLLRELLLVIPQLTHFVSEPQKFQMFLAQLNQLRLLRGSGGLDLFEFRPDLLQLLLALGGQFGVLGVATGNPQNCHREQCHYPAA